MGYDDIPDLNERTEKQSAMSFKDGIDFDVSLACTRFPSIVVGSSPPVSLYDGTTDFCDMTNLLATEGYEDFLAHSIGEEQTHNSLHETWDSLDPTVSSVQTSSPREPNSHMLPLTPQPNTLVTEEKFSQPVTVDDSVWLVSQIDETSIEPFLDGTVSCIPGLRKRHCHQLEDSGFHTVCFIRYYVKGKKSIFLEIFKEGFTLYWCFLFPCSCGNCYTIFLGPMLIYEMLRLELKMDNT